MPGYGDQQQYPKFSQDPDRLDYFFNLPIGATGAPGTITDGGSGWTFTRTGAGTYNITFPKCVALSITCDPISVASTVISAQLTAQSASAGTATLVTRNAAGAATDPANGDILQFSGTVRTKGV